MHGYKMHLGMIYLMNYQLSTCRIEKALYLYINKVGQTLTENVETISQ